jgi:hypothetical protein
MHETLKKKNNLDEFYSDECSCPLNCGRVKNMLVALSYARKIFVTCVHGAKQQNKLAFHLSNLKIVTIKLSKINKQTNARPTTNLAVL